MVEIITVGVRLDRSDSGAIGVNGVCVVFIVVNIVGVLIIINIDDVTYWDGKFLDGPGVARRMTRNRNWVSGR